MTSSIYIFFSSAIGCLEIKINDRFLSMHHRHREVLAHKQTWQQCDLETREKNNLKKKKARRKTCKISKPENTTKDYQKKIKNPFPSYHHIEYSKVRIHCTVQKILLWL